MAKFNEKVGPYANSKDNKAFLKPDPQKQSRDRDRTTTVFDNGDRTDGFAAKLTPPKE